MYGCYCRLHQPCQGFQRQQGKQGAPGVCFTWCVKSALMSDILLLTLPAANLPSNVRQSQHGAEVVGLVPIYRRHQMSEDLTSGDHAVNAKRLLWNAYDTMLSPLMPERFDDPSQYFINGFRYGLIACIEQKCLVCLFFLPCGTIWVLPF